MSFLCFLSGIICICLFICAWLNYKYDNNTLKILNVIAFGLDAIFAILFVIMLQ